MQKCGLCHPVNLLHIFRKRFRKNTFGRLPEAFVRGCSVKKVFLETSQNSQGNTCARDSFWIKLQAQACNLIKKESLAQMFPCKFCKISKNTFFYRTPPVAASGLLLLLVNLIIFDEAGLKRLFLIKLQTFICSQGSFIICFPWVSKCSCLVDIFLTGVSA